MLAKCKHRTQVQTQMRRQGCRNMVFILRQGKGNTGLRKLGLDWLKLEAGNIELRLVAGKQGQRDEGQETEQMGLQGTRDWDWSQSRQD